jgi:hypothetical protein
VNFRVGFGTTIVKNTDNLGPAEFRARVEEISRLGNFDALEVRYIWTDAEGEHLLQILPAGIQDLSWDAKAAQGWRIKEAWITLGN